MEGGEASADLATAKGEAAEAAEADPKGALDPLGAPKGEAAALGALALAPPTDV